jgi:tryptophanyl-tRNA synthetase
LKDVKDPENCSIVDLYKLFASEQEVAELSEKYRAGGFGYGHAKQALFERMWDYFEPFRQKRDELIADEGYVESILQDGAKRASIVADETMSKIRKAVGLMR